MRIQQKEPFSTGYNKITERNGIGADMRMDFGVLKLERGTNYQVGQQLEKVMVLLYGEIQVTYQGETYLAKREDCMDDDFWALDLPEGVTAELRGLAEDSEVILIQTENPTPFQPVIHDKKNSVIEIRGQGFMQEAGTRIVKTMMDKKLAPESNLMLGEDVHYPGKWSGFPSHSHRQPEIYFYKFYPENGFGLLKLGDEGVLLEHNDTITIDPGLVHPQVAAPGYAMYYLWVIRHLEGDPYLKPDYEEQHLWVEKEGAVYWPDRTGKDVR